MRFGQLSPADQASQRGQHVRTRKALAGSNMPGRRLLESLCGVQPGDEQGEESGRGGVDGQMSLAAHSLPSRALPAELSCCDMNSAWPQLHILNWPYFPHTSLDQPEARVPLLHLHSLLRCTAGAAPSLAWSHACSPQQCRAIIRALLSGAPLPSP